MANSRLSTVYHSEKLRRSIMVAKEFIPQYSVFLVRQIKDRRVKTISKKTLRQIIDEFPIFQWTEEDLEELVVTKESLITGFQELLQQIEELEAFDFEEIGPAGVLQKFKETDGTQ